MKCNDDFVQCATSTNIYSARCFQSIEPFRVVCHYAEKSESKIRDDFSFFSLLDARTVNEIVINQLKISSGHCGTI